MDFIRYGEYWVTLVFKDIFSGTHDKISEKIAYSVLEKKKKLFFYL